MKTLFKLAILLLVAHALFRFVPPYWNFTQFKSMLKEQAVAWHQQSEPQVVDEVLRLAQANDVPLAAENVRVKRQQDRLFIDVSYDAPIEILPSVRRTWTFATSVEAWTMAPVKTP